MSRLRHVIAVVLAAGRGTRMGTLCAAAPKPLLDLGGRPILEHILAGLRDAGIREAIVVTGHRGADIEAHLGDGSRVGMWIGYRRQERPLGTGHALLLARDAVGDRPFVLAWGDVVVDPAEYGELLAAFARAPCDALVAVNRTSDPWRGAAVYVDDAGRVLAIREKPPRGSSRTPWNNAGLFVLGPAIFEHAAELGPSPRGEVELPQALAAMIAAGREVRAHPIRGAWSDLGTPEDLCAERFRRAFGRPAAFVVRAPGRVNLIGEHTDYNGLPVLPMAIDRSVRIAGAARSDGEVRLRNAGAGWAPRTFVLGSSIEPGAAGDWANYVKAAAVGLLGAGAPIRRGADLLVDGDLPPGAGLASSSALVVGSALALLASDEIEMPLEALADRLAVAERYVGTRSGGMDQAASLLSRAGGALRVDFFPLRARPVPLPAGYQFVACGSLVVAEKSGAARDAYNQRVDECGRACRMIEGALGAALRRPLARLGDLPAALPGVSPRDLVGRVAPALADPVLRARVRHVLTEAARVGEAEACLAAGDALGFGRLMDESHASCRDDYQVSHPALEDLVAVARQAGAVGARLTGAGFGGSTVSLVPAAGLDSFLEQVDRAFYRPRLGAGARVEDHRFVLRAEDGAEVMRWPRTD